MTTKTKAVNYTSEAVETMLEMYKGADNKTEVAQIAAALGKSTGSVRAKLAQLGAYVVPLKAAKTAKTDSKEAIAEAIAEKVGLKDFEVEGLTKATKAPLLKILESLTV
jgi:hypothetical protein